MGVGIWLALLGVLAASNLIIAKKPDAKELIGKIAPYQGWIGALSALWGAFQLIRALVNISIMSVTVIGWVLWAGTGALTLILGFLLGVGVMKTFIKNPAAQSKMDQTITKLAPFQGKLGLLAIALGGFYVIWDIIH